MKAAVLSNVNLDMLAGEFGKKHELFKTEGYGQWVNYALEQNKKLLAFAPKIIFLIIDAFALFESCASPEAIKDEISFNMQIIRKLTENYPQTLIAVSNIDFRNKKIHAAAQLGCEREIEALWQSGLQKIIDEKKNAVLFDLKSVIENNGRHTIYSDKMWYMGSIPYSIKGMAEIEAEMCGLIALLEEKRCKVLACDLDNTLWGGVVGEDGADGITLGESLIGALYRDTQKRIKEISQTGILLAIVSKNNPEDADLAFDKNPFMVLKKDDFISIKCNWKLKSENIAALAKELNVGLDSFVFLDDNPVEREEVKERLPEVNIADFPRDPANLPKAIDDLYRKYFWCMKETAEDRSKTEQYRQEALRKKDFEAAASLEDYIKSLNICIKLGEVKETQIERTVQLLNKTNQFNTNTRRFDMQEFLQYKAEADNHIFIANVSDKYGDNGLVTVLLAARKGKTVTVENFLMSCRVMGRQIENAVIRAIADKFTAEGAEKICASYIKTAKNKPVEELYEKLGFELKCVSDGHKDYELKLPSKIKSLLDAEWF